MTEALALPKEPRALVPVAFSEDRPAWLAARATGISASEIRDIAVGGRQTWLRILDDKLNGESFHGNAETNRGRMREPFLLAHAATLAAVEPNSVLYAHPMFPQFMATPDGIGTHEGRRVGVEVKSHAFGWDRDDAPADHYDQCQWGMLVTDASAWLYVWEVMGEDGEPTLDEPRHVWIERDEERISQLLSEAIAFLEWWANGASLVDDDVPVEVDEALAEWATARAEKKAAEAREKSAEAVIRAHIAAAEFDSVLKLSGSRASFTFTKETVAVIDEDRWTAEEPETHAAWQSQRARARQFEEAALEKFPGEMEKTRLVITPHRGEGKK